MTDEIVRDEVDEPERYELEAEPFPHTLPIRTDLFDLFGNGLVVLATVDAEASDFDVWLHVGETGTVTLCTGKAEVGQNVRTSLSQAAADELPVPLDDIVTSFGDTDRSPFDIGTFGSRTTPITMPQVRRAAAAAREALIDLGADLWNANRDVLRADAGSVHHPITGESVPFGQLVRAVRLVRIAYPDTVTLPANRWTAGGTSVPKRDAAEFVLGSHRYTYDLAVDGMLYGKVLRPPAYRAALVSIDTKAAEAMPGVTVVRHGDFVGVAAASPSEAERALNTIAAEWAMPDLENTWTGWQSSPFTAASQATQADHVREDASYSIAFIAHVPLEPRAALAIWDGDRLTVWTGTQRPFGVREELVVAFGLPEDKVRVIVPDTGSGYGGKHAGDAAIEAARLSMATGKPVKITWTREEEFTSAYFRPGGRIDISAEVTTSGSLIRWEFHNYNSGAAQIQSPYDIANSITEFHEVLSPLRQGSYRALAATANHFARESHMDDLAHILDMDPLAFRLRNLSNDRMRAVLETAARAFGWDERAGRVRETQTELFGCGLACGTEKGSYVANCVEVAVDKGTHAVRLVRIVAAYECGAIVNPNHLESQVEGAIVMGIGGALFEAISYDGASVLNPRLSEYRVPRFSDIPEIEIVLMDRKDLPSVGAGETPIVAIAPAIGNAIFDAAGIRFRNLPMLPADSLERAQSGD